MLIHFDAFSAMISTAATVAGYKISVVASRFISNLTGTPMPDWLQWVVGPVGALACLGLGLFWMSRRLAAAEKRADEREAKRDEKIEALHQTNTEFAHASLRITDRVGRAIESLVEELEDRPCGMGLARKASVKLETETNK